MEDAGGDAYGGSSDPRPNGPSGGGESTGEVVSTVDPEALENLRLGAKRGQAELFEAPAEELLRLRLEGDNAERCAKLLRDALTFRDQRLMAPMHAVEIADRHDGALRRTRNRLEVAGNDHILGRAGASKVASPSATTVSPTLATQSSVTRRRSFALTVQVATTWSPMRTGALKFKVCAT